MKFAAQPEPAPGRRAAAFLAVAVHLLLAAFLFYGIRWQSHLPDAVEVDLVRAYPEPSQAAAPPSKMETAPEPVPEPKPELQPEPKVEVEPPHPPPKPEIAIKEKPKPEKPKPVPKPKPAAPLPQKQKYDPFRKQLEEEIKQTAERKSAADATATAAQELAQLKAAQAASARDRAKGDYEAKIRGKIRGNIVLPPGIKGNPEAIFDVVQLPSGEILSAKLKKSSGYAAYDQAVERAILKSSPLPKPEQADLFSRSLELKFKPLDD